MLEVHKKVKDNDDINLIMQVHDELVFEVREEKAEELTKQIQQIMEQAAQLDIPLKVDAGIGDNWDEAH